MTKYSEIKQILEIEVTRPEQNDLANLTHYLHSFGNGASHLFMEPASEYLLKRDSDFSFQAKLPVQWDIPFPPVEKPRFKFIDLFAGIGGIRLAYQNLGGKCVFTSEWNHFAQKTYEANFGEVPFGDINRFEGKESRIPDHDILLAGFPCQPFSIAGVSKKNSLGRLHGFLDETQGTLFFNIAKILETKRPKAFMLENVKNLYSHDQGRTFKVIKATLENDLNYHVFAKVLDGKHYVPQHRERIFIVGFDKDIYQDTPDFKFPEPSTEIKSVVTILENKPLDKYTLSDNLWQYLQDYSEKHRQKGNGFGFGIVNNSGVTRTLSARYYKDGSEILVSQDGKNPRRLTEKECALLQGFPPEFVIPVSMNQAYRQFGNSVVVPLVQAVGKQILKILLNE